jgi:hypothetical protein
MNVSEQFQKVALSINQQSFISALKQMTDSIISCIYVTRIAEAQILHDLRKRKRTNFYEQMDMICHQTESMNAVPISFNAFLQQEIKTVAVFTGGKDILPAISAKHNMIKCARIMYTRFTSQKFKLQQRMSKCQACPDPEVAFCPRY